jgi:hypothetical protein
MATERYFNTVQISCQAIFPFGKLSFKGPPVVYKFASEANSSFSGRPFHPLSYQEEMLQRMDLHNSFVRESSDTSTRDGNV